MGQAAWMVSLLFNTSRLEHNGDSGRLRLDRFVFVVLTHIIDISCFTAINHANVLVYNYQYMLDPKVGM